MLIFRGLRPASYPWKPWEWRFWDSKLETLEKNGLVGRPSNTGHMIRIIRVQLYLKTPNCDVFSKRLPLGFLLGSACFLLPTTTTTAVISTRFHPVSAWSEPSKPRRFVPRARSLISDLCTMMSRVLFVVGLHLVMAEDSPSLRGTQKTR